MLSIQRTLLFAVSLFLVQSCSGGGGGDDGGTGGGSGGGTGGGTTPTDYSVTLPINKINFSREYQGLDTAPLEININYVGDDLLVGYAASTTPAAWLSPPVIKNKTANSATIVFDTVNSHLLAPNLYNTKITISAGKTSGTSSDVVSKEIDVSMLVAQKIKFNGFVGDTSIANTSPLISNTTDTWTVSDDADWVDTTLEVNSGSISLNSTATLSGLTGNSDTATATLTNATTQETYTIPLAVGLDNIYLFADQPALSFVSTETVKNTRAILNISNNAQRAVAWTATSNVEWLNAEPLSATQLDVIADTSGLTLDAISEATITVTATTETGVISDVIPVTAFLSNGEVIPFDIDTSGLDINSNAVFVYPAGPYVYAGVGNQINVYNQYTGELLKEIEVSPAGTQLQNFVVHPKGTTLIAQTNEGDTVKRYKINLALADVTSAEITNSEITADPYKFIGVDGRYFIVTNTLEFSDEDLLLVNTPENITFTPSSISIASNANTIFAINDSDSTINRFTVSANDSEENIVATFLTHSYHPTELAADGTITDIAVTSNESSIYIVSDSSEWLTFDATAPVASAFTDNGLLDTSTDLLITNEANELQGLYSPETIDITTHSVYVDSLNQPHFMRTVKFDSSTISYETYTYKYTGQLNTNAIDGKQNLVNLQYITSAESEVVNAPYSLDFTLSNSHIVLSNTNTDTIKIAGISFSPFSNPSPYLLEDERDSLADVIFSIKLFNISSDWSTVIFESEPTPWITRTVDSTDVQILDVTLTTATSSLEPGVYEKEIFVYDKINKVQSKIRVKLTVPES